MAILTPENEDVETQLTKIMAKNSPLMKQARTQGLSSAQNIGLGNSTAGIRAAEAAAYNAAVPLASQSAQQGHATNQQTALFGQQTGLQEGQQRHETGMQAAEFGQAATQAQLDRAQQTILTTHQANLDKEKMYEGAMLERGTLGITQAHEASMAAAERASKEWLANIDMSNANKERAAASLSAANQTYSQGVGAVMSNPNLPADVRNSQLQHLENIRTHSDQITRSLYGNF